MKYASDFRQIARNALQGKWVIAVVAGMIASLLGAVGNGGPELNIELNEGEFNASLQMFGRDVISSNGTSELLHIFSGIAVYAAIFAVVIGVAMFILGNIVEIGYARFHLDLLDRQKEAEISTLFGFFSIWKRAACARLLRSVYVLLWSLLFIIPGIIAVYSYAMTGYILSDHPELTAGEALERSKQMMSGNRWRLFCLQISFIGWDLLSVALTFGIGSLWIAPYKQTATAAFYREISGTEYLYAQPRQPQMDEQ